MTGWRQAVFVRQRRIDVIQRALSKVLDAESWSPATPRRLRIGAADASSRGWTMIVPELANFFLERGGTPLPRLCRLARELRCPAYEVDVRDASATTLCEVDPHGRARVSGAPIHVLAAIARGEAGDTGDATAVIDVAGKVVGFGLIHVAGDHDDRRGAVAGPAMALADHLGALAGFPGWTRHGDAVITAGELIYEPPPIVTSARGSARDLRVALDAALTSTFETRAAIGRTTPRGGLPALDRTGRRPRSAPRPRR